MSQLDIQRAKRRKQHQIANLIKKELPLDELTFAIARRHGHELGTLETIKNDVVMVRRCAWHAAGDWGALHERIRRFDHSRTTLRAVGCPSRVYPIERATQAQCTSCVPLNSPMHTKSDDGARRWVIYPDHVRIFRAVDSMAIDPLTVFPFLGRGFDPDMQRMFIGCGFGRNPTVSMWGEMRIGAMNEHQNVEVKWHQLDPATRAHLRRKIVE